MTDRAAERRDQAAAPKRKSAPATAPADKASRSVDPLDREIGRRVRARRVAAGLSQKRLAALLGVRFQQVQKYENGANRIAASRLLDIANALETAIEHFYVDLQPTLGPSELIGRIQSIPEAASALASFGAIPDAVVRRKLLSLARAIAGQVDDVARGRDDDGASTVGNDPGAP